MPIRRIDVVIAGSARVTVNRAQSPNEDATTTHGVVRNLTVAAVREHCPPQSSALFPIDELQLGLGRHHDIQDHTSTGSVPSEKV
jgi:hypothetical protein